MPRDATASARGRYFQIVQRTAAIGQQSGHGFGRIDGTTAAQADHQITRRLASDCGRLLDVVDHRFATLLPDDGSYARLGQPFAQTIRNAAVTRLAGIRHDQSCPAPFCGQFTDSMGRPAAEDQTGHGEEFERFHDYDTVSPKKILWCLMPWRG